MSEQTISVTALVPYILDSAPNQRYRWEQWAPLLSEHGVEVSFLTFGTPEIDALHRAGRSREVLAHAAARYPSWMAELVRQTRAADVVVVPRNAALAGPPLGEWVATNLIGKPLVYDLDDAVWLAPPPPDPTWRKLIRCDWRVDYIGRWASIVAAGNDYLAEHMRQFCDHVEVWPTTVSMAQYTEHPYGEEKPVPVIGWTGSPSTAKYLAQILPILREIQREEPFELLVVGAELDLGDLVGRCEPWTPKTEVSLVHEMDIGLMPLPDNPWTRGKCGMKAIQYLGTGIPAVVSDVGVNAAVVRHGDLGGLVHEPSDWSRHLLSLLRDPGRRRSIGLEGRAHVTEHYSAQSVAPRIARTLRALRSGRGRH